MKPKTPAAVSFSQLGLSKPTLEAIKKKGYSEPTAIQCEAIPLVRQGKDLMAAAQTGTGKTASFTLPIIEKIKNSDKSSDRHIKVLVLTPTRELAKQVEESVKAYSENMDISSQVVFGGVKINPQIRNLAKGIDVLVATPGRLLDLANQGQVKFSELEILVLDEADRMLDMGFIRDIKKIVSYLPKQRQTLLFSATFTPEIRQIAKQFLTKPVEISTNRKNSTATTVKQWIHPVDKKQKPALLRQLIHDNLWEQVLVFTKTKHGANKLSYYLEEEGITATAIHSNKSQGARNKALKRFKEGEVRILVATDIAARGLDIEQLPQVVNFDLPGNPEDYIHRIGRTGRAGSKGQAISLVCADEIKQLIEIEFLIKSKLDRALYDGFEPTHDLPLSASRQSKRLDPRAKNNGKRLSKGRKSTNTKSKSRKTTKKRTAKTSEKTQKNRTQKNKPQRNNKSTQKRTAKKTAKKNSAKRHKPIRQSHKSTNSKGKNRR